MIRAKLAFLVLLATPAGAVPLRLVRDATGAGKIYVACSFDGRTELCELDTGAEVTQVSTNHFGDYPTISRNQLAGLTGVPTAVDMIRVEQVGLAGELLPARTVARDDTPARLGMDLFSGRIAVFQLAVSPPELWFASEGSRCDQTGLMVYGDNLFSLPASASGAPGKEADGAIWDTGAGVTLVDRDLLKQQPQAFVLGSGYSTTLDSHGHGKLSQPCTIKRLWVGQRLFENVPAAATDFRYIRSAVSPRARFVLGFDLLTRADWMFDFPRRTWAVSKG